MIIRRTANLDLAIAAGLALLSLSALFVVAGDLFPMMEFRDWRLGGPGAWENFGRVLSEGWRGLTRQTPFSRWLPLAFAQVVLDRCERDIPCMNTALLVPIALSVGLLYLLARRLGAGIAAACVAALFWLVSSPVAEAVSWQATVFDRMALVLVLATLLVYLWFTARPMTPGRLLTCNLVVGLLTAASLMSKEAAFPLPAVLVLLAWGEVGHGTPRHRRLLGLVLPLAYAAFYEIAYLQDPVMFAPPTEGPGIGDRAAFYTAILFPFVQHWVGALIACLALVTVFALCRYWIARSATAACLMLAAAFLFVLPITGTRFLLPYYFYIPLAFFALSYALLATAVVQRASLRVVVLLPLVAGAGYFLAMESRPYRHILEASENFRDSLRVLGALPGIDPARQLFVLTPEDFPAHNFVVGNLRELWRYANPEAARNINPALVVSWRYGNQCPEDTQDQCLLFDQRLRLIDVPAPMSSR